MEGRYTPRSWIACMLVAFTLNVPVSIGLGKVYHHDGNWIPAIIGSVVFWAVWSLWMYAGPPWKLPSRFMLGLTMFWASMGGRLEYLEVAAGDPPHVERFWALRRKP